MKHIFIKPVQSLCPDSSGLSTIMSLLKDVARSFYLSIKILPRSMQYPVGLAYLLARIADTIVDDQVNNNKSKLEMLLEFRIQINKTDASKNTKIMTVDIGNKNESVKKKQFIEKLPIALKSFDDLEEDDAIEVRNLVDTIASGMQLELSTFFEYQTDQPIVAIPTTQDQEKYIYLVAGSVGEFWTNMTIRHTSSLSRHDADHMRQLGVSFGKALQLTNIIKDVPEDLRSGRCYIPSNELSRYDLSPEDLLDAKTNKRTQLLLYANIERVLKYYIDAQSYVLAIPRSNIRLRLAAIWPLTFGLATLSKISKGSNWLNPTIPSKIHRLSIYKIILISLFAVQSNFILEFWVSRLIKEVTETVKYS